MMTRCLVLATAAALLAAPIAGSAQDTVQRRHGEFQSSVGSRRYAVWAPPRSDASRARPLVVVLHGCLQNADDIANATRFEARAARDTFLLLYPEQSPAVNPARCWMWYDAAHQTRDAGEPALLAALTRSVARELGVDSSRIYVVGISAGGAMAVTLLATHPDVFAAGAVHSATPYRAVAGVLPALALMRRGGHDDSVRTERVLMASGERRAPRPLLVIHGAADTVVVARNGEQLVAQWSGALAASLGRALDRAVTDTIIRTRAATRTAFRAGDRVLVEHWVVQGLGHAWSGGSESAKYSDGAGPRATDLIADFFGLGRPAR